jgi:dihydropteroate synthase
VIPGLPRPGRCAVMGVLNVTPDSFSDGGRYLDLDQALEHAREMWARGADLIDVGGESTRPGALRVDAETEAARVLPVIRQLASEGVALSVDTTRAVVAEAAVEAGARVINDVSGGLADANMGRVAAQCRVPWVLMHWRGHSKIMRQLAVYDDVVVDVRRELLARVDAAVSYGVDPDQIVLDPGLGFAKTGAHDWALLQRLGEFVALGLPVLIGASRKSFLGRLLAGPDGTPRPVGEREDATTATTAFAALNGVWGVRVHQVRANVDSALVTAAIQRGRGDAR